jgi:hypothetical protein
MGVFDGIENVAAEGTSLRQYFESGSYSVTIDRVFLHEKRLGGGKIFVVETTVDASDNPNISPGDKRNWAQSFALPSALARIKAFIGASLGLCPQRQTKEIYAKVTATICDKSVSDANPLQGKKLSLRCTAKTTRTGKEFIQHMWGVLHG